MPLLAWVGGLGTAVLPRRVGLGVEVDHDHAPAQPREHDGLAVLVGQLEVGCWCAGLDHVRNVRTPRQARY